ncbi:hypothetical protein [Brucella intermedia]|uniref:hypothetical protein n=1 Tax=Brucella intermedia TaxID=94625 RepID=UPI00236287E2|nr:hypothetical protein [Brucella intermedia]
MKKLVIASIAIAFTSAFVSVGNANGNLDATDPVVRNPDVQIATEQGYLNSHDLAADTRGTDRGNNHR